MNIKHIEPIAVSLPMKKPVFMAGVEIKRADNVLVRIEADNGIVGWGEAAEAPTMMRSGLSGRMPAISATLSVIEAAMVAESSSPAAATPSAAATW